MTGQAAMLAGGGTLKAPAFTLAEGATHVAMLNSQRRFGFTLAEVLVTLGIIGVVSAMTVPSLMQNYQRQSYVAQLHKVYNETSQAIIQYVNDRNAINIKEAGLLSNDAIDEFVKKYYKVIQDCGTEYLPCFADEYKGLNGVSKGALFNSTAYNHYVLASGAAVMLSARDDNIQFYIDTNGRKGPNIVGRDAFAIQIYIDGTLDDRATPYVSSTTPPTKDEREATYTNTCANQTTGGEWWGCFGKILNDNWQMTY